MSIPSNSRMIAQRRYLSKDNVGVPEKATTVSKMKPTSK